MASSFSSSSLRLLSALLLLLLSSHCLLVVGQTETASACGNDAVWIEVGPYCQRHSAHLLPSPPPPAPRSYRRILTLSFCVALRSLSPAPPLLLSVVDGQAARSNVVAGESGLPLNITLLILDGRNTTSDQCIPLQNVKVDTWSCDWEGIYSDESAENSLGETYLRGYQLTNSSGYTAFQTLYPGWYSGRTTHVHFRLRVYDGVNGALSYDETTQLFFNDSITNYIYSNIAPYTSHPGRDTTDATDRVYAIQNQLNLTGDYTNGFTSFLHLTIPLGGTSSNYILGNASNAGGGGSGTTTTTTSGGGGGGNPGAAASSSTAAATTLRGSSSAAAATSAAAAMSAVRRASSSSAGAVSAAATSATYISTSAGATSQSTNTCGNDLVWIEVGPYCQWPLTLLAALQPSTLLSSSSSSYPFDLRCPSPALLPPFSRGRSGAAQRRGVGGVRPAAQHNPPHPRRPQTPPRTSASRCRT